MTAALPAEVVHSWCGSLGRYAVQVAWSRTGWQWRDVDALVHTEIVSLHRLATDDGLIMFRFVVGGFSMAIGWIT